MAESHTSIKEQTSDQFPENAFTKIIEMINNIQPPGI